jgi:hypothetical protein
MPCSRQHYHIEPCGGKGGGIIGGIIALIVAGWLLSHTRAVERGIIDLIEIMTGMLAATIVILIAILIIRLKRSVPSRRVNEIPESKPQAIEAKVTHIDGTPIDEYLKEFKLWKLQHHLIRIKVTLYARTHGVAVRYSIRGKDRNTMKDTILYAMDAEK